MGQPNPPGDIPLIEGLGSEWNDIVSAIPEEQRAELAPKLKERVSSYTELENWRDLHKSGITPDQAGSALNLYNIIENNPKQVYDLIGKSLGITAKEAEQVVEELEEGDPEDPRIATLQNQVETLVAIQLAERQQKTEAETKAEADKWLDGELASLKKKYGDSVDEEQVIMRMVQKGLTAEQAHNEHISYVDSIRARRPAPTLLGGGGSVPQKAIDPTKLSNKETKSLVAQYLEHAKQQGK